MPTIPLHLPSLATLHGSAQGAPSNVQNPLPELLHTPLGLALLELQGSINLPTPEEVEAASHSEAADELSDDKEKDRTKTPIGRVVLPDHDADRAAAGDTTWMKRAYLYVGPHQRLTGEVQVLPKPLAVIRPRQRAAKNSESEDVDVDMTDLSSDRRDGDGHDHDDTAGNGAGEGCEELEIADIIRYKLLFASRPEPIGAGISGLD